jgi:hypothetical protein
MAVKIQTTTPEALLKAFKSAIDKGHIVTWTCDKDGDFTHATDQWRNKAWLRPKISAGELILNILCPQNGAVTTEIYAIYHGRFIEALLAHCDNHFSVAQATSLPTSGDIVNLRPA